MTRSLRTIPGGQQSRKVVVNYYCVFVVGLLNVFQFELQKTV